MVQDTETQILADSKTTSALIDDVEVSGFSFSKVNYPLRVASVYPKGNEQQTFSSIDLSNREGFFFVLGKCGE